MPQVSIIMPTYNRADTILRAISSVQAQSFQDWELVIVNDGSTDNTAELLQNLDSRIKVVNQPNQGVTAARNTGLRHCTSELFAFLDSDDQWLSHHLELCVAFLASHPEAMIVSCELLEDFGDGRVLTHYEVELTKWYPRVANLIGSAKLNLPAGVRDCYLRVYQQRSEVGEWGREILRHAGITGGAYYQGNIFDAWRWGFLMWLPTTLVRRTAAERVGEFSHEYPICSDFDWMAECCRHYIAHFLSVPTGIKHDLAVGGKKLAEGHIAKDKTASVAALDMLRHLENNFCTPNPNDKELAALRSHKLYYLAQVQLSRGLRNHALQHLESAWLHSPEKTQVALLWLFATLVPHAGLCQQLYTFLFRTSYTVSLILHGEISLFSVLAKLPRKLFGHDKAPDLQRA